MDRKIIHALTKDLKRGKDYLNYLRKYPERNFAVDLYSNENNEDYLYPIVEEGAPEEPGVALALGHKKGAFMHIIGMMDLIKKALKGELSRNELPRNAPSHLEACVVD